MPNTERMHRVLASRPQKIYRAFLEADALAKWLPPNGFAATVHHLEPQVGGPFKVSFRNFTTEKSHSFGDQYVELVPGERLRYADKLDDPDLARDIQVTVTLKRVSVGTELKIVQEGLPDVIPTEACYLGWQESLQNLARFVEVACRSHNTRDPRCGVARVHSPLYAPSHCDIGGDFLTGYLGGAVASHARHGDPLFAELIPFTM